MLASDRENDKIATITDNVNEQADYNKAISTTGYGVFNVLLVLGTLPIAWTAIFDTTSGAFILASAECDLELTLFRKGVLVAFPYIAMTMTTFIWDYITPYVSMKILFVLALLIDSILNIVSSGVQSYYIFILVKFLSGILAGGPLAMVMTYLTEFHSARYKPRFTTWVGFLFAIANIVPAALGFTILPLNWHIDIFGQDYNSWRIYLLICSIPPVVGFVTATMLPESPKYLMAIGRSDAALKLFKRMYCMNTRQPSETFPIKALLVPQKTQLTRPVLEASLERMRVSLYNTKLLLTTTAYLPAFSFVSFLQFGSMLGFNTMRLWVPYLFIVLKNFDAANWTPKDRQPTMCEMLDRHAALPGRQYLNCTNFDDACFEWTINPRVYQNSTTIASSAVIFSFLAGFLTITKLRKQIIIHGLPDIGGKQFRNKLGAVFTVHADAGGNGYRDDKNSGATSISILAVIGNIAAVVGNLIFSALLGTECIVAFMGLGCLFFACFCVSLFFPPPVRESSKKLAEASTSKI
ncbi:hypothetical protein ACFW04_003988 [Cataglyphis niger]